MKEYRFVEQATAEGIACVCVSHTAEQCKDDVDTAYAALRQWVIDNDIDESTFAGVMFVPYEFYFDENGAAGFRGPAADDPLYDQERFSEALEQFTAETLDERGAASPEEAWINVGGTYCCGPTWKENPHYTGVPAPHPESTVH